MRISRMAMAMLTGLLFVVTFLAMRVLQNLVFPGRADDRVPLGTALAVSLGALWLADRFDLMAPSQTPPVVDLYEKDEPEAKRVRDTESGGGGSNAGRSK